MSQSTARLRRLLADELGECCDADVERRLDELQGLAATAFADGEERSPSGSRTESDDDTQTVFAVLGNETRYRLARVLSVAGDERCVCELEALVDVSESAVSHALSDLVDAGLVARRKDGNWRYYESTGLADSLFAVADGGTTDGATMSEGSA
ncbi:ArsR/SmtB family transcription factor [Halobacterium zhouii]|uniref:ArsR/SmtB family transcription factor n=1 Tax=Halobacterium zhouii TaxID=2902624 RepID=UPI001E3B7446|nr:metalloregulator ArsR/SmtB family transcription factor [Halobacterium zhouii]